MRLALLVASLPRDRLEGRQLPLGVGYLAAYVLREVPGVEVLTTASLDEALDWGPHVLGVSSTTAAMPQAVYAAHRARKLGIVTVLGGAHITALPRLLPPAFDFGVPGEGEERLAALLRYLMRSARQTPGLVSTPDHGPWNDRYLEPRGMDALPHPRRDVHFGAQVHLLTSRGCPYRCAFCSTSRAWGRPRYHSARRVASELLDLRERGAGSIHLLDDMAFGDVARLRELADLLDEAGWQERGLPLDGFVASRAATLEVVELARRIGFRALKFGLETASDALLRRIKPGASVAAHQRLIDLCEEHGIECRASVMIGSPGETEDDLRATLAFLAAHRGRLVVHGLYLASPLPGTPWWHLAMERGIVSEDMDWSCYAGMDLTRDCERPRLYIGDLPWAATAGWVERIREVVG